jgi:hypothetical protein
MTIDICLSRKKCVTIITCYSLIGVIDKIVITGNQYDGIHILFLSSNPFFSVSSIVTFRMNLFTLFHLTSSLSLSCSHTFFFIQVEQSRRLAMLICLSMYMHVLYINEKNVIVVSYCRVRVVEKKARIIACSCTPLNTTRRR